MRIKQPWQIFPILLSASRKHTRHPFRYARYKVRAGVRRSNCTDVPDVARRQNCVGTLYPYRSQMQSVFDVYTCSHLLVVRTCRIYAHTSGHAVIGVSACIYKRHAPVNVLSAYLVETLTLGGICTYTCVHACANSNTHRLCVRQIC